MYTNEDAPGRVFVAAVVVHCIVVARRHSTHSANSAHSAAALFLLLGRVWRRASQREQRVGQVSDEGNLEVVTIVNRQFYYISCEIKYTEYNKLEDSTRERIK